MNAIKAACLAALNGLKPFGQLTVDDLGAQIIYRPKRTIYYHGTKSFSEPNTKAREAANIRDALLKMPTMSDLKGAGG